MSNALEKGSATERLRKKRLDRCSNGTAKLPAGAPAARFRAASWQE
ncbi:hypothetical protein J2T07_000385 [Luteibacter jiangsuensis]|uniref:Uncharacterized protein n=1 Tax=Luteibacter jiangsuensis TaxID=637577 RepID=A0ABT9SV12_9GAMM|nr:hypothetical protein [Luteibacter jiangsuensis]MDQ0008226.1 hypothetical protein [Luteibacter jiangsuensis]